MNHIVCKSLILVSVKVTATLTTCMGNWRSFSQIESGTKKKKKKKEKALSFLVSNWTSFTHSVYMCSLKHIKCYTLTQSYAMKQYNFKYKF